MGIGNYFMNTNVDLFHDSTNNSNGILTSESNEMDLNTLIPVVDNNNHKVVDARLLHAFLQIRRDFTSWIKDRISKYGFIENQDFVLIKYDYFGYYIYTQNHPHPYTHTRSFPPSSYRSRRTALLFRKRPRSS